MWPAESAAACGAGGGASTAPPPPPRRPSARDRHRHRRRPASSRHPAATWWPSSRRGPWRRGLGPGRQGPRRRRRADDHRRGPWRGAAVCRCLVRRRPGDLHLVQRRRAACRLVEVRRVLRPRGAPASARARAQCLAAGARGCRACWRRPGGASRGLPARPGHRRPARGGRLCRRAPPRPSARLDRRTRGSPGQRGRPIGRRGPRGRTGHLAAEDPRATARFAGCAGDSYVVYYWGERQALRPSAQSPPTAPSKHTCAVCGQRRAGAGERRADRSVGTGQTAAAGHMASKGTRDRMEENHRRTHQHHRPLEPLRTSPRLS